MTSVTVKLDSDTAVLFTKAPAEDRIKLSLLWCLLIREYRSEDSSLRRLMDQIGAKARKRGLTTEKLDAILNAN